MRNRNKENSKDKYKNMDTERERTIVNIVNK